MTARLVIRRWSVSNETRYSIKHKYAEISVVDNGDESIGISVEEFNDDQWFARINLSKHQAIELRNFLNEFIGDENE